jgi:hypothetical protein
VTRRPLLLTAVLAALPVTLLGVAAGADPAPDNPGNHYGWDKHTDPTTTAPTTTAPTTSPPPATTPPTTTPPPVAFHEDFATPGAFRQRFDFDWAGEVQAGSLFGAARNDWHGDHNEMCGDPTTTGRTIHVEAGDDEAFQPDNGLPKDVSAVFYQCAPGGDNARAHVMTSVDTVGYVAAWFSPKQIFHDVTQVCFDLNLTDMGGGKWPVVTFLTPAEYEGHTDLGYTTQRFPGGDGSASTPQGAAAHGIDLSFGGMQIWNNHRLGASVNGSTTSDKATRYHHCIDDNGDGTVTLTKHHPGGLAVRTVTGFIPDGNIRVVFLDDNYDPPKREGYNPQALTWHWDNILITERAD